MSRSLKDVLLTERGVSWNEYERRQWAQWRAEAKALHPPDEVPPAPPLRDSGNSGQLDLEVKK